MVRSESGSIKLDHDLKRRVINYLAQQHFPQLHAVEVRAWQGVVTIRGRVSSFYERQLCINCCQRVAGVVQVNDQIEVGRRRLNSISPRPMALAVS